MCNFYLNVLIVIILGIVDVQSHRALCEYSAIKIYFIIIIIIIIIFSIVNTTIMYGFYIQIYIHGIIKFSCIVFYTYVHKPRLFSIT